MKRNNSLIKLTTFALMIAFSYIGFTYLKIDIPLPTGSSAFHLGNVFALIASLLLGPIIGSLSAAIGMSIADILDPRYLLTAPKTFILKTLIGLIASLLAHKVFHINNQSDKKKTLYVFISCFVAMLSNVISEPLFGYFYYQYILDMPQKAASTLAKFNSLTTSVNAILAIIIGSTLYLALAKRLNKSDCLNRLYQE